jgi:hypothetical protein
MDADVPMIADTESVSENPSTDTDFKIQSLDEARKRVKVKEISLRDVVFLPRQVYIDDAHQKAGVLENSKVHDAMLDMCDMGILRIDWSVTRRVVLDSEKHFGNFVVGFSPEQVRAGRDWIQGLFIRSKNRDDLHEDLQKYTDAELLALLKDLHFRKDTVAKIMDTVGSNAPAGVAVRTMIFAWLDSMFLSIMKPMGHEPALENESETDSAPDSAPESVSETKMEDSTSVSSELTLHLCQINSDLHDIVLRTDEQFQSAGLDLTSENAENLFKTHMGCMIRCFLFLNRDEKAGYRFLEDASRMYNSMIQPHPAPEGKRRKKMKAKRR